MGHAMHVRPVCLSNSSTHLAPCLSTQVIEHEDDLDGDEDSLCDDVLVSTDSVHTTRSAVAVMEAAVSSATNHPNVVKTYDYKTSSAGVAGGRATLPGNVSILCGACHTAPSLPSPAGSARVSALCDRGL